VYSRKDILNKAEYYRNEGDTDTAGMLEHLAQLKFSFIPQLITKMEDVGFTWSGEHKFPHFAKAPKPCTHTSE